MATILLVEDDRDTRQMMETLFERLGHKVMGTHDGKQAIQLAIHLRPDIIFMDLLLPRITGWEVAKVIKAQSATSHIPIVAVTAANFIELPFPANRFDHLLKKPFLLAHLREVLQQFSLDSDAQSLV